MVRPSKRHRLTMADGRVLYVYEPTGGRWARLTSAAFAAWCGAVTHVACPIESEPITMQDGRAAPGA